MACVVRCICGFIRADLNFMLYTNTTLQDSTDFWTKRAYLPAMIGYLAARSLLALVSFSASSC